jgi:hypothetical protein
MKKSFMSAALSLVAVVFAGCASIPQNPNLTGQWSYKLTDSITEKESDGTMTLTQKVYEVSGKANDAFGEFAVTGTVPGPKFVLKFVKNDKSLSYTVNVQMTSNDAFEGTFTTTKGKAGTITVTRN